MGLIRDLIGNIASSRIKEHQQRAQQQIQLGELLKNFIQQNADDPDPQKQLLVGQAKGQYVDLLTKHGGKQGRDAVPTVLSLFQLQHLAGRQGGSDQAPPPAREAPDVAGYGPTPGQPAPKLLVNQPAAQPGAGPQPAAAEKPQHRGPFRSALQALAGVGTGMLGIPRDQPFPQIPEGLRQALGPTTPEQAGAIEGRMAAGKEMGAFDAIGKRWSDPQFKEKLEAQGWTKGDILQGMHDAQIKALGITPLRGKAGDFIATDPDGVRHIWTQDADGNFRDEKGEIVARQPGWNLEKVGTARAGSADRPLTRPVDGQWPGIKDYLEAHNLPHDPKASYMVIPDPNDPTKIRAAWPIGAAAARAPTERQQFRDASLKAYADGVLHIPVEKMTPMQHFQAITWGEANKDKDPTLAGAATRVTPTPNNPTGDPATEALAYTWIWSGQLPPAGMGGKGISRQNQALQRGYEMLNQAGLELADLPNLREGIKANQKAFDKVVDQGSILGVLEGTISRNVDLARQLSDRYDRSDYPSINRLRDAWNKGTGGEEANDLAAQLHILASEWAKAMSGAFSNAQLQVGSQQDAENIISRYLSNNQLNELLNNVIIPDLNNRKASYETQKDTLRDTIHSFATLAPETVRTTPATPTPSPTPAPGATTTPPAAPPGAPTPTAPGPSKSLQEFYRLHPEYRPKKKK